MSPENHKAGIEGQRGRVLVVDDELEIRTMLSRYLRSGGFETSTAENGQQALSLLHSLPVDVVVSDLTMPRMNGLNLLQAVREKYPSSRVILMTGRLNEEDIQNGMRLGADSCLLKPLVDLSQLDRALDRSLSLRAAWQATVAELRQRMRSAGGLTIFGQGSLAPTAAPPTRP